MTWPSSKLEFPNKYHSKLITYQSEIINRRRMVRPEQPKVKNFVTAVDMSHQIAAHPDMYFLELLYRL